MPHAVRFPSRRSTPVRRRIALALLLPAVLVVHGGLALGLGAAAPAMGGTPARGSVPAVTLTAPAAGVDRPVPPADPGPARPVAAPAGRATAAAALAAASPRQAPPAGDVPAAAPAADMTPLPEVRLPAPEAADPLEAQAGPTEAASSGGPDATQRLAAADAAAAPAAKAPAAGGDSPAPPPTYPTKPPAATVLEYEIRRGALSGGGELRWQPQADRYEALLAGRVLGIPVLSWRSAGRFDAAGLAPQRFVDERRGRAANAANFQRDKRLISYSGPSATFPLPDGAQDRLSWMIQLAAVLNARSRPPEAGEQFAFFVSGARADADLWVFTVQQRERIRLPAGEFETIRLLREARKPRDTRVDVWVDPAHEFLPVRARMAQTDDDAFDLQLSGFGKP